MLKSKYKKTKCYICHIWMFILVITFAVIWCVSDINEFQEVLVFLKENTWLVILFSSVVALVTAIMAVAKNRQTAREKNSLDFEQSYKNNQSIKKDMRVMSRAFSSKSSLEIKEIAYKKQKDMTEDEKEFVNSCANILNEWERAANAVNHDLYDEHFLYKVYGTSVISLYRNLSCYIQARQSDSPRYYINFVMLVSRWQIRRGVEERLDGKYVKSVSEQQKKLMSIINIMHDG